ncbi:MAG TPA: hypothetical protein VH164_15405 [Ktedonobacteraceae bacterium]|nr:hypothetical protein [Ktedonobacteraceae bacterium]
MAEIGGPVGEYYDEVSLRDMALTHAVSLFSNARPVDEYPASLVVDAADVLLAWLKGEGEAHE